MGNSITLERQGLDRSQAVSRRTQTMKRLLNMFIFSSAPVLLQECKCSETDINPGGDKSDFLIECFYPKTLAQDTSFTECTANTNVTRNRKKTEKLPQKSSLFDPLENIDVCYDKGYLNYVFLLDGNTYQYLNGRESKVMFIMRGLSGSGKSTIVKLLESSFKDVAVCSADNYFYSQDGSYNWNEQLLTAAHDDCQNKAKQACQDKVSVVVIDNTNVRKWEVNFYVNLANVSGYVVVMVMPKTPWRMNPIELAKRNKHGMAVDVLKKKVQMFDDIIPAYYAWFLNERKSEILLKIVTKIYEECLVKLPGLRESLLKELNIKSEHISKEMAGRILSSYFSQEGKKSPLLHCTAKFCGRGKAVKSLDYHKRPDVQNSCGQVFDLTITGIVITNKTMSVRVSLNPQASTLFQRPEEEEWGKTNSSSNDFLEKSTKRQMKKNLRAQKRTKKNKRKELMNSPTSNKNTMPLENQNVHVFDNVVNSVSPTASDTSYETSDISLSASFEEEKPSLLSKTFPSVKFTGEGRSAHITLKTSRGIESREVNFDILRVCDIEAALGENLPFPVPVQKGQACYYGNGICCVYFDKPLKVKTLFSGHY